MRSRAEVNSGTTGRFPAPYRHTIYVLTNLAVNAPSLVMVPGYYDLEAAFGHPRRWSLVVGRWPEYGSRLGHRPSALGQNRQAMHAQADEAALAAFSCARIKNSGSSTPE